MSITPAVTQTMRVPQPAPRAATLYIRAGRVITGLDGEQQTIEDAGIRIEGGRIVAVGSASQVTPPADTMTPVADHRDRTVMAGLVDAHVHLTFRRGETTVSHVAETSETVALLRGAQAARLALNAGITTVRDCAARGLVGQALRDAVRDGLIPGPRILTSGRPITTTAGHLWALGIEADTGDACRQAVRTLVKEGVDFIKVCATGGGMTPGSVVGRAQYGEAELRAVAEDAHRFGRLVAAHAHGTEGLARAVDAGIDSIEHCSWYTLEGKAGGFDEAVARRMAGRGTFANIASSAPRELLGLDEAPDARRPETAGKRSSLDRWEQAKKMMALGVPVCFSTDAVYGWWEDGLDLAYLAQAMVEAGEFTREDTLHMITAVPARAIGWGDQIGTVEPGKLADVIAVDGNPLEDIRALHRVTHVYQEGVRVRG